MSKVNLRFENLHFTAKAVKDCKKANLSESIAKGLAHRHAVSAYLAFVLLLLFSGGAWHIAINKASIMEQVKEQVKEGANILYYGMFIGSAGFVVLFGYGLIEEILNYINVPKETIISIDADLSDIQYKITSNRTRQPFLRIKKRFNVAPISGVTSEKELFDEGVTYRFYFTKKSKVFLAVEALKAHNK